MIFCCPCALSLVLFVLAENDLGISFALNNIIFELTINVNLYQYVLEYEIIGEGSQISANQKQESTVSWLLIGRNLRPFPDNFALFNSMNE